MSCKQLVLTLLVPGQCAKSRAPEDIQVDTFKMECLFLCHDRATSCMWGAGQLCTHCLFTQGVDEHEQVDGTGRGSSCWQMQAPEKNKRCTLDTFPSPSKSPCEPQFKKPRVVGEKTHSYDHLFLMGLFAEQMPGSVRIVLR